MNAAAPPAFAMRKRVHALFNLAGLLLLAVLCAALVTAYLLRLDDRNQSQLALPGHYALLVQHGSVVTAVSGAGVARSLQLPIPLSGQSSLRFSPDGRAVLAFAATYDGGAHGVWLFRKGAAAAVLLPAPPAPTVSDRWHAVEAQWLGTARAAILYANEAQARVCAVGSYDMAGSRGASPTWSYIQALNGTCLALSPDGTEVAVALTQAPRDGFEAQVAIRLIHIAGGARSTAIQYTGSKIPDALLWSPDGGTLVLRIPGQGLAIQKSSGRAVRAVPDGDLPASFSPRGAAIAYVSGTNRDRTIHVLNLHGEVESTMLAPAAGTPELLAWTPDTRALLYGSRAGMWQVDPVTAQAMRLRMPATGAPIGVVAAGGWFLPAG